MKLRYLYILLVSVWMTSCTDVIDLELEDPSPVFVVDGYVTDSLEVQTVRLSNLENYFAEGLPNFSIHKDANVQLFENGVSVGTYTYNDSLQRFELFYKGIPGNEYQIDVTLSDGTGYLSDSELMEEVSPIDTIWVTYNEKGGSGFQDEIQVSIATWEPAGVGDFYQWKTYVNGEYNSDPFDLFFFDDRFVDGTYVNPLDVYGMTYEDFDQYKADSPNGQVFVQVTQTQISQRYFKFLTIVSQQTAQSGTPFSAPAAEIQGNVYKKGENDVRALGYFYTSSVSVKTIEIIEQK